jgi:hypothetical protein
MGSEISGFDTLDKMTNLLLLAHILSPFSVGVHIM